MNKTNLSANAFIKALDAHGGFEPRSRDLIVHGDLKWKQFAKHIKWKNKNVLDVGCHIALIAIRAAARGAKSVGGIDIREDVIGFNSAFCKQHKIHNINFRLGALDHNLMVTQVDIVLCLGVIHKFPKGEYQEMVAKLCSMAYETLVLETCFNLGIATGFTSSHHPTSQWKYHTRPSVHSLTALLKKNGFTVTKRIKSVAHAEDARETWIATRGK